MRRLVFCLFVLVFSFCTVCSADENWPHLRTLFSEGGLPTETSLKPRQKWSCTDGVFYIFEVAGRAITAYTNSDHINFLITPESLRQEVQRGRNITSFIRVSQTTGDLIVEQTTLAEPFNTTLPAALSDENQRSLGYVQCQASYASLLSEEAAHFTQMALGFSRLMVAISEREVERYEQQLLQGHYRVSFREALDTAFQSYFTDDGDLENLLAVIQTPEPNFERTTVTSPERVGNDLNQRVALLTLLPLEETAPHGEIPSTHWIFVLSVEGLSDHQFFAVCDPVNQGGYSYGFN